MLNSITLLSNNRNGGIKIYSGNSGIIDGALVYGYINLTADNCTDEAEASSINFYNLLPFIYQIYMNIHLFLFLFFIYL